MFMVLTEATSHQAPSNEKFITHIRTSCGNRIAVQVRLCVQLYLSRDEVVGLNYSNREGTLFARVKFLMIGLLCPAKSDFN